jgi:hypothetical protein
MTERIAELVAALQEAGDEASPEEIGALVEVAARWIRVRGDREGKQVLKVDPQAITATEAVVMVTALLEAADISVFDLALWARRGS